MITANNKDPLSAKHLVYVLIVVLSILISACNPSARSEKQVKLTPEETKENAKNAFLFGMPLVLFEIQFDFNSNVSKPMGLEAPVNQFGHSREFVDASNRLIIGFNVDNLYSLNQFIWVTDLINVIILEQSDHPQEK